MNEFLSILFPPELTPSTPDIPYFFIACAHITSCITYVYAWKSRQSAQRTILSLLCTCLGYLIIHLCGGYLLPIGFWPLELIASLLLTYVCLSTLFHTSLHTRIFLVCRVYSLSAFMMALEWHIWFYYAGLFPAIRRFDASVPTMLISFTFMCCVASVLEKRIPISPSKLSISAIQSTMAVIITLSGFLLTHISMVFPHTPFSTSMGNHSYYVRSLINFIILGLLYAMVLQIQDFQSRSELASLQMIAALQHQQFEKSRDIQEVLNHKYHDFKHQISVLRRQTDPEQHNAYFDNLERTLHEYENQFNTGNTTVDAVIQEKATLCLHHNIEFTCVADGHALSQFDVMDVCTLLGNALDNAIEAEQHIDDTSKRFIHIVIKQHQQFVHIRVENYIEQPVPITSKLPATTKTDIHYHGFGLKSMQRVARSYHGDIVISQSTNTFVLKILLPLVSSPLE